MKSHDKSFDVSAVEISHIVEDSPTREENPIYRKLKHVVPVGKQFSTQSALNIHMPSLHPRPMKSKQWVQDISNSSILHSPQKHAKVQLHFRITAEGYTSDKLERDSRRQNIKALPEESRITLNIKSEKSLAFQEQCCMGKNGKKAQEN